MRTLTIWLGLMLAASTADARFDFNADWSTTGVVGEGHGDAAVTVGDVNGDGYSDVAVGAPDFGAAPNYSRGKVALYYGGPDGLTAGPYWNHVGDTADGRFGQAIAPAGDMNGDG